MNKILNYVMGGVRNFDQNTFFRMLKSKYAEWEVFKRANIYLSHSTFKLLEESWDDILPLSVSEALSEENLEKRRVMFSCIGPSKLFSEMEPELLSREVIKKKNRKWDEENNLFNEDFEDVYELYCIPGEKIFPLSARNIRNSTSIYAVRCWCTTTGREYWIFVPETIVYGERTSIFREQVDKLKPSAIKAIAWTFRTGYSYDDIEEIYRQGDCLIVKPKEGAIEQSLMHMDEKTYREKLVCES
jgi:hypothetical protein